MINKKIKRLFSLIISAYVITVNIGVYAESAVQPNDIADYGQNSKYVAMSYTDNEAALQTAAVMTTDSPIALIRNAKRYMSADDVTLKPQKIGTEMYVTADIIRELLRVCVEENNGSVTVKDDNTGVIEISKDGSIVTVNGVRKSDTAALQSYNNYKLLPLKFICGVFGKAVTESGNAVIVDEKDRIDLVTVEVLAYALEELAANPYTSGKVFHVAQKNQNANDGNSGTENAPFKTINAATAIAEAGDKIIVHEGVYRETVAFANSGGRGNPIVLEGAEGEDVTVSAADRLEKLVKYKDNEYFAKVPNAMKRKNQVYINGEAYAEGRHPNTPNVEGRIVMSDYADLCRMWPMEGDITVKDRTTPYTLYSEDLLNQSQPDYWKYAVWHGLLHEGWRSSASVVTSSREKSVKIAENVEPNGLSFGYWGGTEYEIPTDYGYLTDHVNAVDVPGEWAIKGNTLYMIMPDGTDPKVDLVEYKARQLLFDLTGKSNISIKNIKGFGGSVTMKDADLCMISNCDFKYVSHFTWFADSREGYIDDKSDESENGSQTRGEVGLYIGGANNIVKDCRIDISAGAGLFIAGKYAYIYNNVLTECGYAGIMNAGMYVAFEPWKVDANDYTTQDVFGGHAIYYNSVSRCGRSAMAINSCYSWLLDKTPTRFAAMDIAYNDFCEGGILSGRDGGIYYSYGTILGDNTISTKIHNNLFWDYYAYDGFDCGMYFDAGTTDAEVYGNVIFYTNEYAGFEIASYNVDSVHQVMHKVNLFDWNNSIARYKPGGKETLTSDDYPNGFTFKSGSTLIPEGNITPAEGNAEKYLFRDAELSEGIISYGQGVKPTSTDDMIVFRDVDFKDGSNAVELCFTGYANGDRDKLQFRLDSADGDVFLSKSFISGAPDTEKKDDVIIDIKPISGVHDVYASFMQISSASLISFTPIYRSIRHDEDENAASLLLECEKFDTRGYVGPNPNTWLIEAMADGVNHTWSGDWICFEGASLKSCYNTVRVQYSTKGENSGNTLKIMIDSLENEPIAEFLLEGEDWNEKVDLEYTLTDGISEGLHEVYVLFGDNDNIFASSNLYEVEFLTK